MKIESIVDRASRQIQEWIVTGRFKPGEQIKEENISQRLEISRPPVREALKMLEATGLVLRKPRRGVFVPHLTKKDIWEIYTLKAVLYELAVTLAMDTISPKEIDELEVLVQEMEVSVKNDPGNLLRYQKLHKAFHDSIMTIAGNTRLKTFASNLHNQVTPFSYRSLQHRDHLFSSVAYHRRIVEAIKKKDRSLACHLMKEHVLNALNVLSEMLDLEQETTAVLPSRGRGAGTDKDNRRYPRVANNLF